nr:MAG TPA: cysteine-rich protein [Caudoviricetes sp.]
MILNWLSCPYCRTCWYSSKTIISYFWTIIIKIKSVVGSFSYTNFYNIISIIITPCLKRLTIRGWI